LAIKAISPVTTKGVTVGFTVTVAVIEADVQPYTVPVIVNVTVTGNPVILVSDPKILPVPLAAIPVTVAVLSLVQLYTAPAGAPDKTIFVIAVPVQTVWLEGVALIVKLGQLITKL
jgi:hypothetical protein